MANLRIFGTILIICGCTFDKGNGVTSPPTQTSICLSETVRGYTWNETVSGITASQPCQSPYNRGQTFRTCKDGTWTEPEYSTCKTVAIADRDTIYLIQYVCCGTTILTVLLTLFILVFAWRNPGAGTTILEISFGLAIIASNVAFIAGVNNTADELMCQITAVCLHYLPTVTVFHLFAVIFHLATLKVQTSPNSYCCLLLTAWGTPAIIVGVYGYFTTLEEYGNSENCWVVFYNRLFWVYYGTLMAICGLIFLSLFGIIYRLKLPGRGPKMGSAIGTVPMFIVFITTIMTWVTGVISVNEYNDGLYITQIVFGTFNFLQGLAYLIVFGVMGSRARKEKVRRKSEIRLSKMSLPTVSTYAGYKDDHIRNWSYERFLDSTQRKLFTDFYSPDEEVQQRYLESRRRENHYNKRASEMAAREDLQGNPSSPQGNTSPERQGNDVVVVHKEVVYAPDRFQSADQLGPITDTTTDQRVHTIQQQLVNTNDPYQNTSTEDERIRFSFTNIASVIPQEQRRDFGNVTPKDFSNSDDDYDDGDAFDISKILVQDSQAQTPSDNHIEPKDTAHHNDEDDGTQTSSPVTQRPRNVIDPPAPSRISVTEIETFTIDVPEENVSKNESNEFILQDEGEVVMEYRNGNIIQNHRYQTTNHLDHEESSQPDEKSIFSYPSYLEQAAADYDAKSHTESTTVNQEEEGNTLQHITKDIAMGNGYEQADEDYVDALSSPQPVPLIADSEDHPESSYSKRQQEPQSSDISDHSDDDAKPKSRLNVSSSFLDRLRKKLKPNLTDSPPKLAVHQEPSPQPDTDYITSPNLAIQNQPHDGNGSHRQLVWPDEDLLPPPINNLEEPIAINRPPTPPSPFIGLPPVTPPLNPQSSPYGKHVSFSNDDVEISSRL